MVSAKIRLYKSESESCDKVQGTMEKRKGRCELLSHFLLSFQQSPLHANVLCQRDRWEQYRYKGQLEVQNMKLCLIVFFKTFLPNPVVPAQKWLMIVQAESRMCGSRKYPYPSHGWFFRLDPSTPSEFPFERGHA